MTYVKTSGVVGINRSSYMFFSPPNVFCAWMSQEVSKWLVNGLSPYI